MVLDTSAVTAILLNEPEADRFRAAIADDPVRLMSAVSAVEATCVLESRRGAQAGVELEFFVYKVGIKFVPFDADQLEVARSAWRLYGRGKHPAGLNFGDCAAYALARTAGEPLLFKGGDFAKTDILPSVP